jgi:hypothetical protein
MVGGSAVPAAVIIVEDTQITQCGKWNRRCDGSGDRFAPAKIGEARNEGSTEEFGRRVG